MTKHLVETYLKVGRTASLCVIAAAILGGCLIATMKYRPILLSPETTESLQMAIALFFFLGWAATIGSYAVVARKSRLFTWVLFCVFPPFALFAMFILITKGSSSKLPTLGIAANGLYVLRAIVGLDN